MEKTLRRCADQIVEASLILNGLMICFIKEKSEAKRS